jgi:hypothetical protein
VAGHSPFSFFYSIAISFSREAAQSSSSTGKEIEARLQRRAQNISRSVLGGVFSEQVAPFLPNFPEGSQSIRSPLHPQANRLPLDLEDRDRAGVG